MIVHAPAPAVGFEVVVGVDVMPPVRGLAGVAHYLASELRRRADGLDAKQVQVQALVTGRQVRGLTDGEQQRLLGLAREASCARS